MCCIGLSGHHPEKVFESVHHHLLQREPGADGSDHQHAAQGMRGPGSDHKRPIAPQSLLVDSLQSDGISDDADQKGS